MQSSNPGVIEKPVQVQTEGRPIILESPGFGAPHVADLDGNGTRKYLWVSLTEEDDGVRFGKK